MTGRRCYLDDLSIFRLLRDTMRHVDLPARVTPAVRKAISLTAALRVAEAESQATLAEVARCAEVPPSQGTSGGAADLVERIHEHVAAGILKDAVDLESSGVPEAVLAAKTLRRHAALLVAKKG